MSRNGSILAFSQQTSVIETNVNRDCVFSLHQNLRASLLYGKNNVSVKKTTKSDGIQLFKGYLSMHQDNLNFLTLKWTPNMLIHSE